MEKCFLTTNQGAPVENGQVSLTVGPRGPILLEDVLYQEKMAHLNRERLPERVIHAKGAGAFGCFKLYKSLAAYTKARFLQDPARETPLFARFSLATGARGGADTVRDIRGFALRFYTEEGNYDLIGNHIPVFPIRDPMQFPDLLHALKPNPVSNIQGGRKGASRLWDYFSEMPSAMHFLLYLFSDIGTVKSFRQIQGFSVNTYQWINCAGKARYVRYRWDPADGVACIDARTAAKLAGTDPDIAARDLYNTLAEGKTVEYELCVQQMDPENCLGLSIDPLDPTKLWPEKDFPWQPIGRIILRRNPKNYFVEVEQAAFSPASVVPGIAFSNDRILQGRLFAYGDAQRYRLGVNYADLPTNRPVVPVRNHTQDGRMRRQYDGRIANYAPNTLDKNAPLPAPACGETAPEYADGCIARRSVPADDYAQPREYYRSRTAAQRDCLAGNLADSLRQAYPQLQQRMLEHFAKTDPALARAIAERLR